MGKTSIEYADEVSNPLYARPIGDETVKVGTFCEKPDPEGTCKHCWAESLNKRFGNGFAFDKSNRDKIEWMPRPAEIARLQRLNAKKPMSEKFPGNPLVVFTNDTYDIFQPSISDEQRDWVFDEFDRLENLTLLVQTTYVARMSAYLRGRYPDGMPSHYFIGMSAGTQKFFNDNREHLCRVPVARRYVIFEPILEQIKAFETNREAHEEAAGMGLDYMFFSYNNIDLNGLYNPGFSLFIIGGESGSNARPCSAEWIWDLVLQGKKAGVSVLVKQLGSYPQVENANSMEWPASTMFVSSGADGYARARVRLNDSKGKVMSEWPESLRVRELPEAKRN
jgi:protein gp37